MIKFSQKAVVKAINEVIGNKHEFLSILQDNIAIVLNEEYDKNTAEIDKRLEELQQKILLLAISKSDYNTIADEIHRLREIKQNVMAENAERQGKRQRITEMEEFLCMQECRMVEYDEQLVSRLVGKVTVLLGIEIDVLI